MESQSFTFTSLGMNIEKATLRWFNIRATSPETEKLFRHF